MTSLKEMEKALRKLPARRAAQVAFAAVERFRGVFEAAATTASRPVYGEVADELWRGRAKGATERIADLPEASEDDSHKESFYAGMALGILELAIKAAQAADPVPDACRAANEALELAASIDTLIGGLLGEEEEFEPGPWETFEQQAQERVRDRLAGKAEPAGLREEAAADAAKLTEAFREAMRAKKKRARR